MILIGWSLGTIGLPMLMLWSIVGTVFYQTVLRENPSCMEAAGVPAPWIFLGNIIFNYFILFVYLMILISVCLDSVQIGRRIGAQLFDVTDSNSELFEPLLLGDVDNVEPKFKGLNTNELELVHLTELGSQDVHH